MPKFEIPELSQESEIAEIKKMLESIQQYLDEPPKTHRSFQAFEETTALKTLPTRAIPTAVLASPALESTTKVWPGWLQFLSWSALAFISAVIYFFVYALHIAPP